MSIVSGTLTVNPAFLAEIKRDHRQLPAVLNRTTTLISQMTVTGGQPAGLVELLEEVRGRLSSHFALEEAFGYFDDAVTVAPRLSEKAAALRQEHEFFLQEACRICGLARELLDDENWLRCLQNVAEVFHRFRERFEGHEAGENELIVQAFNDDIGVGD